MKNFLKMTSIRVWISPESNLITDDHVEIALAWIKNSAVAILSNLRTPLEQPHFTSAEAHRMFTIFKKFNVKTNFKLKNKCDTEIR
jgi:hypothetical protein